MTEHLIAHLTDCHLGQRLVMGRDIDNDKMRYDPVSGEHEQHLRRVLDDILRKGIKHVVFGGDIGARDTAGGFFELLKGYPFTLSVVAGNHDTYRDIVPHWRADAEPVAGKLCYSHRDGPWTFIVLDTSDNTAGEVQRMWLKDQLADATRVALFLHHPVLDIETPIDRAGAALRDRTELKDILAAAACDISVFCGHYHMIDEAQEGHIRQFVSPATSYQIVKRAKSLQVDKTTFGYRILNVSDREIRTEAVLLTEA